MEKAMEDQILSMVEERGFNDQGIPSIQCTIIQYIKNEEFLIEDAEDITDSSIRREYLLHIWKEFVKHENDFWLRCFNKYHNIDHTKELGTMGFWIDNPEEEIPFEVTTLGMNLMMKIEDFPNLINRLVEYYNTLDIKEDDDDPKMEREKILKEIWELLHLYNWTVQTKDEFIEDFNNKIIRVKKTKKFLAIFCSLLIGYRRKDDRLIISKEAISEYKFFCKNKSYTINELFNTINRELKNATSEERNFIKEFDKLLD